MSARSGVDLDQLAPLDPWDDFRLFCGGVPTDVMDSSTLTTSELDRELWGPDVPPADLVPRLAGQGDHQLASTPAGADLAALVEIFDRSTLQDSELVDYVVACDTVKSWLDSCQLAAVAELTRRCARLRGVGVGTDEVPAEVMAAAEIAPALRVSPASAAARVALAGRLARLPATRAALAAGRIDLAKARAVMAAVEPLDDDAAARVDATVMVRAPGQTLANLQACLRRAVISADPAGAQQRHERARRERGVWREVLEDGMGRLEFVGPIEQVEAAYQWVTAMATRAQESDRRRARDQRARGAEPDPVRLLDQCRADVLGDLGAQGLSGRLPFPWGAGVGGDGAGPAAPCRCGGDEPPAATPPLPRRHGRAPQIGVVVAATTLLGLDDEPGELVGVGPITAEVARRLAAEGTWRRLLTEPATGRLLSMSTDTYHPPQEMVDFVLARDGTCRGPGCRMPADRCDLDHTVEWPSGPTCVGNLSALCRSHHRVKTLTATSVETDGHGGLRWTMPSGKRYHRPADPVLDRTGVIRPDVERAPF